MCENSVRAFLINDADILTNREKGRASTRLAYCANFTVSIRIYNHLRLQLSKQFSPSTNQAVFMVSSNRATERKTRQTDTGEITGSPHGPHSGWGCNDESNKRAASERERASLRVCKLDGIHAIPHWLF